MTRLPGPQSTVRVTVPPYKGWTGKVVRVHAHPIHGLIYEIAATDPVSKQTVHINVNREYLRLLHNDNPVLDPEWEEPPPDPPPPSDLSDNDRVAIRTEPYVDKVGYVWEESFRRSFDDPNKGLWVYGIALDDDEPDEGDIPIEQQLLWVRREDILLLYSDGDFLKEAEEILDDNANRDAASSYSTPSDRDIEKYGNDVFVVANFGDWYGSSGEDMSPSLPRIPRGFVEVKGGGRVPDYEAEIEMESLLEDLTYTMTKKIPKRFHKVIEADIEEWSKEEYKDKNTGGVKRWVYWGASGDVTIYVPKKKAEELEEEGE